MDPDHVILTPREVTDLLRFSKVDVTYGLIETGQLPATKIAGRWRIRRSDVEALLAGEPS